jgi:hypothetical protein
MTMFGAVWGRREEGVEEGRERSILFCIYRGLLRFVSFSFSFWTFFFSFLFSRNPRRDRDAHAKLKCKGHLGLKC